jgi:hypothetical protein
LIPVFSRNSAEIACCEIDTLADKAYDIGLFSLCVSREPHDILLNVIVTET